MEQSYESGYVLHHISRMLIKSQTARMPLGSLVSHIFFKFIIAFYVFAVSLDSTPVCSSDPPTALSTTNCRPDYQKAAYGYKIFSDDDSHPVDEGQHSCNNDTLMDLDIETINLPIPHKQTIIQSWIALSYFPGTRRKLGFHCVERIFASFAMHSQLKEANMNSRFE